ncbi:MAG: hypothetical protein K2M48_01090, partial [Clostridiales bacterium]|nr:hypothetical protein [Clostridiales bacterium]
LKQNLIDAGCDEQFINRFMVLSEEQKTADMLKMLAQHRKSVLACIHSEEKQIYCLDFLANRLKTLI